MLNAGACKHKEAKNNLSAIKQLENLSATPYYHQTVLGVGYGTAERRRRGRSRTPPLRARSAASRRWGVRGNALCRVRPAGVLSPGAEGLGAGRHGELIPAAASSPAGAPSRSKKRPASPGTGSGPAKKRTTVLASSQSAGGEAMNENKFHTDSSAGSVETTVKPLPFKDPNFIHSGIGGAAAGKKNRTWKNLKQIASERALPWQLNDPSYFNIDAPPSFKPAKNSDISGLPANYTDPQSKLRFSTIEEFAYIRMLPSDVVTGYGSKEATSIVS
ncbi:LOW QUALITY PROTEIN: INO80 complex subunit C [Pterocles gutturalis]